MTSPLIKKNLLNLSYSYLTLPEFFYTRLSPTSVNTPEMVIFNENLASSMGTELSGLSAQEKLDIFSGNQLPPGTQPFAQAYAGHQFGHFTILGDGRAIVLGEYTALDHKKYDIQFKGSGQTPYSRNGDGRAALGPMLREYIVSEAMHHLGIPTTRSLAVVATGEAVMRETPLPGAILTRVAASHIRVGTFEFAAEQGDLKSLKALLDYAIERHYPHLITCEQKALEFLKAVMKEQIALVVNAMRVGFIHGVMNTDNMTISGEMIDYGPCAFMDGYHRDKVFSSIDHRGRYAYGNQPQITQWNLAKLAEALLPCFHDDENTAIEIASNVLNQFFDVFHQQWESMMRTKLGLFGQVEGDMQLIADLFSWMQTNSADFTLTFHTLSQGYQPIDALYQQDGFIAWYEQWRARLEKNKKSLKESVRLMKSVNPAVIPRNHKIEAVIQAAYAGDMKPFHQMVSVLRTPYEDHEQLAPYQMVPLSHERVYQTFCGT